MNELIFYTIAANPWLSLVILLGLWACFWFWLGYIVRGPGNE